MVFAAILAGGAGARAKTDIPKQFLVLGEKPILIQTIDVFLRSECVDFFYISVNEMWRQYTKELLEQYYDVETRKNMKIILGGKERMMTFLNVIYDIRDNFGVRMEDIVLSHDAVRPFVTVEIIKDCLEKTMESGVAMATVRSADTVYSSQQPGYLTKTYNRKDIYTGQTPQGCKMSLMYDVISSYSEEELMSMTGTSQLFTNKNIPVRISLGSGANLKITTLDDIEYLTYSFKKGKTTDKSGNDELKQGEAK